MNKNLAAWLIRTFSGVRPIPPALCPPDPVVYFANHSSHLDFLAIWAALPPDRRSRTRPVAGRDYWEETPLRRRLARDCFNAVLIERRHVTVTANPLEPMLAALADANSLIVFPEGTRSPDGQIQQFKSGLYHLARSRPGTLLVPVYLQNLSRILPKGEFLPLPMIASLSVGTPLHLEDKEEKSVFLGRARAAVQKLAA